MGSVLIQWNLNEAHEKLQGEEELYKKMQAPNIRAESLQKWNCNATNPNTVDNEQNTVEGR